MPIHVVDGQAANVAPVKPNKLGKGAHARVVASHMVCVVPSARAHRFDRGLPEQAVNKGDRRSVVKNNPVVARQRHPNWRKSDRSLELSLHGGTTVTESFA